MRSWEPEQIYKPIPQNVVFYEGPSMLNGGRILAVASAQNSNRKIGRMLQLWIIPAISPIEAVKTGRDAAVCGDCKLRGVLGKQRTCYVEYFRAVENIWQSARKPDRTDYKSPEALAKKIAGLRLKIRIGAYGDPVAIPVDVWRPLLEVAANWTAYTHQWRQSFAAPYRPWCMASVDSADEQRQAAAMGWKTFRVRDAGAPLGVDEIVCPHERDAVIQCAGCSLCRGAGRPSKHIVVTAHGSGRKWFPMQPVTPRVPAEALP